MEETVRTAAPAGTFHGIASHLVVFALTTAFWAFAGWQVYVEVPHTKRLVEDFGLVVPLAVVWLMWNGWWLAPAVAVASVAWGFTARQRWAARLGVVLTPVFVWAAYYGMGNFIVAKIVDTLSR